MRRSAYFYILSFTLLETICLSNLEAAPRYNSQSDSVDVLRHEISNLQSEINVFDAKFKNIEDMLSTLQSKVDKTSQDSKESLRGKTDSIDSKIQSFSADIRELQNHANQSTTALESYKKKIADLEKSIAEQNRTIDHLKSAIKSMLDVVAPGHAPLSDGEQLYQVKDGDSLGIIAQKFKVSIKEIKALNGLKNDVIIVGQKLKIPK
jgi:LysM repeat protein